MKLQTKHFGEIDIEESKLIRFEEGLPGFTECKRFILLKDDKDTNTDSDGIFWWLQSADDGEVAFVLLNLFVILPDYNPLVNKDDVAELGEFDPDKFLVYNIAVIPDEVDRMSVNLKAPIIINTELQKGKQIVVTNDEYGVKHYIFDELKNNE